MAQSADARERARSVSDPSSPDYDQGSPFYDVTADSSSKYYVGPVEDDAKSGDEIRSDVTAQFDDTFTNSDNWLMRLIGASVKDAVIQKRYSERLEDARHELVDGLDLRAPGDAPQTIWTNASHEQMYEFISTNADSAAVAETSEEWVRLGNELTDHQQSLADAINDSMSNWQGAGGDAARTHLAEVAKWVGGTAQGATLTGRQQEIHSQALNEAQKQMGANPPVQFSAQEANARLQQIKDPVQYAQQFSQDMQAYQEQQVAREQAARIMTQFDETVGAAVVTPKFTAPPKLQQRTAATRTSARVMQGSQAGGAGLDGEGNPDSATALGTKAGGLGEPAGISSPGSHSDASSLAKPLAASAPELDSGSVPGGGSIPGGSVPSGGSIPGSNPGSIPDIGGGSTTSGVPGIPGGSSSGAGQLDAAKFNAPTFDGSTTTSGYTPPSTGSIPNLSSSIPGDSTTKGSSFSGGGVPSGTTPGIGYSPTSPGSSFNNSTKDSTKDSTKSGGSPRIPTIGRGGGINGESIQSRLGGLNPPSGSGVGGGSLGGGGGLGGSKGLGGIGSGGGAGLPGGGLGSRTDMEGTGSRGSAVGSGATPGEGAAGTRSAGSPGARGATGAPMGAAGAGAGMGAGAGKGQGGEDKEHRVAEYLEEDSDIFAAEDVVAPPVIGDWKNNKDWK